MGKRGANACRGPGRRTAGAGIARNSVLGVEPRRETLDSGVEPRRKTLDSGVEPRRETLGPGS